MERGLGLTTRVDSGRTVPQLVNLSFVCVATPAARPGFLRAALCSTTQAYLEGVSTLPKRTMCLFRPACCLTISPFYQARLKYRMGLKGVCVCCALACSFISTPLGWTAYIGGCPFLGYGREVGIGTHCIDAGARIMRCVQDVPASYRVMDRGCLVCE